MDNISKGSCVSRGGGDVPLTKIRISLKRCATNKVNKCVVCLTIWNRRVLLIYSNVLNLVPNKGTRILSLVGYYSLVLLFGQIRVPCLMSSIDWNPSPDKYISAYAHYYYTSHIMLIYTCVTPCIFTWNYLRCLNACQWRYGLQLFFPELIVYELIGVSFPPQGDFCKHTSSERALYQKHFKPC